jgi:DNA invertase Pin-like site-specific DNA recombinase
MLSVMGAFAEFERSLIRERQKEGIALAKQRGAYKGRKKTLTPERAAELVQRADNVSRKPSLRVTTESVGKPSTSTCATPSWSAPLPYRRRWRAAAAPTAT